MGTDATGRPQLQDLSLLVAAFDESPVPTLRVAVRDGFVAVILDANPAARRLLGAADPVGSQLSDLVVATPLLAVEQRPTHHLLTLPAVDVGLGQSADTLGDSVRWVEASVVALSAAASPGRPAALVTLQDVTERRAHEHLREQEQRVDPLTGLAERHSLRARLGTLDVAADGPMVAALYLDLDRFKRVNDERGHAAGDELLVAVAHRLRTVTRPEDLVARVGGDEFVVICPRLTGPEDAAAIAERVRGALLHPVEVGGRVLQVTASVGVASEDVGALDPTALLAAADAAMYAAKQAGGNRVAAEPAATGAAARWLPGLRRSRRR